MECLKYFESILKDIYFRNILVCFRNRFFEFFLREERRLNYSFNIQNVNKNERRVCRTFDRRQWKTREKLVNGLEMTTAPFVNTTTSLAAIN